MAIVRPREPEGSEKVVILVGWVEAMVGVVEGGFAGFGFLLD